MRENQVYFAPQNASRRAKPKSFARRYFQSYRDPTLTAMDAGLSAGEAQKFGVIGIGHDEHITVLDQAEILCR